MGLMPGLDSLGTGRGIFSEKLGELQKNLSHLIDVYHKMWRAAPTDMPPFPKRYSQKRQKELERELTSFMDRLSDRIKDYSPDEEENWFEAFAADFRDCAQKVFALSDVTVDSLLKKGFAETTRDFVDEVKRFDPSLSIENVYQALRNVWIMNTLQIYTGEEVRLTDAMFGYSLIYPYSDNFLDDPSLSLDHKIGMAGRLRLWLEGETVEPREDNESRIRDLIRRIEQVFPRDRFPGVYQSLLSIYNAQIRSLTQQRKENLPSSSDILEISVEKGGTSVLADGYLVKGDLEARQADFCFGFGFFLQLADDLQDVSEDRRNGHMTVFSQTAGKHPLDDLANKLFHLTDTVVRVKLGRKDNEVRLRGMILENTRLLLMEAVGKNPRLYTRAYLQEMETFFPVRFAFLKKFRARVKRNLVENRTVALDLNFASAFLLTALSRTIS